MATGFLDTCTCTCHFANTIANFALGYLASFMRFCFLSCTIRSLHFHFRSLYSLYYMYLQCRLVPSYHLSSMRSSLSRLTLAVITNIVHPLLPLLLRLSLLVLALCFCSCLCLSLTVVTNIIHSWLSRPVPGCHY